MWVARSCPRTYLYGMIRKEFILEEIRRIANSSGKPPGQKKFVKTTGIPQSYWSGYYWARWSEALTEAGLEPNERNAAIPIPELLKKYLGLVAEIGSTPTMSELRLKARRDPSFPATSTFSNRIGTQTQLFERAHSHGLSIGYDAAVLALLEEKIAKITPDVSSDPQAVEGYVYLLQSGRHYKVGRSDDVERRLKQIRVSMPEKVELVHAIRTDDPAGIEIYWHRRFSDKRLNGEWFNLESGDVRAFRRRKFQ